MIIKIFQKSMAALFEKKSRVYVIISRYNNWSKLSLACFKISVISHLNELL